MVELIDKDNRISHKLENIRKRKREGVTTRNEKSKGRRVKINEILNFYSTTFDKKSTKYFNYFTYN